jgi:hypothetical protein
MTAITGALVIDVVVVPTSGSCSIDEFVSVFAGCPAQRSLLPWAYGLFKV